MNKVWLNRNGNNRCVLFFNGWGMDENAVAHLDAGDFDICMFNDYNPITTIEEDFSEYAFTFVVAWSLGVWAAAKVLSKSKIRIDRAIAINGTLQPISNDYGIPSQIFNATLETWSDTNRDKFNIRMMGGRKQHAILLDRLPKRDTINQKNELNNIQIEVTSNNTFEPFFNTVLIGNGDLIFSPTNQQNYWKSNAKTIIKDIPHYPFADFTSWNEIISL